MPRLGKSRCFSSPLAKRGEKKAVEDRGKRMITMPKKKGTIFEKDKKSEFEDEPEEFLEGEEHAGSHEDAEFKIHVGDKEADVYTEEGEDELTEDAEIAPWEEGFSKGAELIEGGHCAHCHKPLGDRDEGVIEKEYKGETLFFCSEKCAEAGAVKKKG